MGIIRVLHVVTRMEAEGIQTLLMNFYRNIDRNKVQFDFLVHRKDEGFYDNEILNLGGRIYKIPSINPFKHRNYLRALDTFFSEHKEYKIVHSHINNYSMYPLRAAMKAGVPVRIAHSHTANVPFGFKTPFIIYTKSKLKAYSTYNFACSEMAGKWLYGSDAIARNNFKIINNSVNSSLYTYNEKIRKKVKDDMSINGKFVIGHIGRFNKCKNHDFLIQVFKKIHDKEQNSVLMLVGDGEFKHRIEKKVTDLGLQDCTIFTGVRSDVPELLQAMDVFVFPSLFEGLGIVAIEAQAAGLPCIVADTIPKEAYITDLIKPLSLKASADIWSQAILQYTDGYERRNTYEEIKTSGYDICDTVKWLEKFYLNRLVE